MMPTILDFIRRARMELSIPAGRVLEVGSFDVNGSPRSEFADAVHYLGVDAQPGPGVDLVLDATCLTDVFGPNEFDTVASFECLEHTVRPWLVVERMRHVLRPGGYLWVSTPGYGFPLHRFPLDCYRFGEDAYRHWIFADMNLLKLAHVSDHLNQPAIVAVGRKLRC